LAVTALRPACADAWAAAFFAGAAFRPAFFAATGRLPPGVFFAVFAVFFFAVFFFAAFFFAVGFAAFAPFFFAAAGLLRATAFFAVVGFFADFFLLADRLLPVALAIAPPPHGRNLPGCLSFSGR
jgi:hypothetical protein